MLEALSLSVIRCPWQKPKHFESESKHACLYMHGICFGLHADEDPWEVCHADCVQLGNEAEFVLGPSACEEGQLATLSYGLDSDATDIVKGAVAPSMCISKVSGQTSSVAASALHTELRETLDLNEVWVASATDGCQLLPFFSA